DQTLEMCWVKDYHLYKKEHRTGRFFSYYFLNGGTKQNTDVKMYKFVRYEYKDYTLRLEYKNGLIRIKTHKNILSKALKLHILICKPYSTKQILPLKSEACKQGRIDLKLVISYLFSEIFYSIFTQNSTRHSRHKNGSTYKKYAKKALYKIYHSSMIKCLLFFEWQWRNNGSQGQIVFPEMNTILNCLQVSKVFLCFVILIDLNQKTKHHRNKSYFLSLMGGMESKVGPLMNFRISFLFYLLSVRWDLFISSNILFVFSSISVLVFSQGHMTQDSQGKNLQALTPSMHKTQARSSFLPSTSKLKSPLMNVPHANVLLYELLNKFTLPPTMEECSPCSTTSPVYKPFTILLLRISFLDLNSIFLIGVDENIFPFLSYQAVLLLKIAFVTPRISNSLCTNFGLLNSYEMYNILNVWNFPSSLRQIVKVGTFSPNAPQDQELFLSDHIIQWPTGFTESSLSVCSESCAPGFRKSPQEGKASCCHACAPCPDSEISNDTDKYVHNCEKCPESHYANTQQNYCLQKSVIFLSYEDFLGMKLSCIALGCTLLTAGVLGVFVKHYHTPIVKANNRVLTYILLITLIFCFLCPLLFIGHPNTATCILQQSTFAVLFTMALSTVLAKTLTVVLAFKITVTGRMVRWLMTSRAPNFIIPICPLIQIVLCGIWLSTSPPFVDLDVHSEHEYIIIKCNKGSELGFHCVLGYFCFLALGSYTMAYLSMNLPDTFNEAKFLIFSMLVFFSVWVTFLPVYHSTKGKVMLAMEIFSVLASSAGLLGCIFAPKCYIILLRPDRNSLNCIKNKGYSRVGLFKGWSGLRAGLLLKFFLCSAFPSSGYAFQMGPETPAVVGAELEHLVPAGMSCGWLLETLQGSLAQTYQGRSWESLGSTNGSFFIVLNCLDKVEKMQHKDDSYIRSRMRDFMKKFNIKNYQAYLGFVFAIEEINRNPHLLPNTSLGFDLYTVQRHKWDFFSQVFLWLTGMRINIPNYTCRRDYKAVAILTGTSWKISALIGRLMNLYKYPQLSFGAFDPILSDRGQFSSLYQTAPKDTSRSLGIISLMIHFSWTWVGLIFIDIHKETHFLSDIIEEFYRNKICLAYLKVVSVISFITDISNKKTFQFIISSANVIIIYDDTESVQDIMLYAMYVLKTWKVWVLNLQLDSSIMIDPLIFALSHGILYFSHHHDEIYEFKKFIKTYTPSNYPEDYNLDYLWSYYFNCSLSLPDCKISSKCVPNASLELFPLNLWNMDMTEETYNIYNSVYAVAHSLHEMTVKQVQIQPHRNGEWNVHPWENVYKSTQAMCVQLHPFLKQIHFENGAGHHMVVDSQINLDEVYNVLSVWNFPTGLRQIIKVGTFSPNAPQGQKLFLSDHMIQWPTGFTEVPNRPRSVCSESCSPGFRKSPQEGKASCCHACAPCPDNEISNDTDVHNCVKCPETHYANTQQNYCLQKSVTFLAYEDPLGMALSCIALGCSLLTAGVLGVFVKHHHTPIVKANNRVLTYILLITLIFCFLCSLLFIGHPNTATCILQQSTFAVLFTVALSTVLAKTLTVVLAFKVTVPGRMVRWLMISRAPNFIIPICTIIQLVLCGIWLSTSPPFIELDVHSEHGHIIIKCNKGSELAFHCVLGYLCFLALGSYTMAYLSMNLPDTFNEAKFLTFSMLMFFSVWVTFLPVYHSTKGKVMVAMETFSVLASSAGLLGCIFTPKCYIILKMDEFMFRCCVTDDVKAMVVWGYTVWSKERKEYESTFYLKNYQSYLGFIFAIEEINKNPTLLPNTTLGFDLYNVKRDKWNFFKEVFLCLTGMGINIPNYTCRKEYKTVVILTGPSWKISARIGRLLNLYKYPQLSFGAFDSILSDRVQFSSLYQTATKDSSLSLGIISLMIHFSWTWVGLIFMDNHKEAQFISDIMEEFHKNKICLAFLQVMSEISTLSLILNKKTVELIMKSSANVIIIYNDTEFTHGIMLLTMYSFKTWKIWVISIQVDSSIMPDFLIFSLFHGTLFFALHHNEFSEFKKFIQIYTPSKYPEDPYLVLLWRDFFNCSLSLPECKISGNCLPNASLELFPLNLWNMDMIEETYNIYSSVYAVAHSLHEMTVKYVQIQPHRNGEWNAHPWELHPFLKQIHFKNDAGYHVLLDSKIKSDEVYNIFNVWNFPTGLRLNMKVGTFSPNAPQGQKLFLSDHMVQWPTGFTELPRSVCSESCAPGFRKSPEEGKAACCHACAPCPDNEISNDTDVHNCVKCPETHYANTEQNYCLQKSVSFLSYEDPLGMALSCIALGCTLLTAGVLGVFVKHHHTPIVKANNGVLTYILLITLIFCFLCSLLFIGHPNTATCILQQSTFAVLFTVALSTVLAKTLTVVLAFKITVPGRMMRRLMISGTPNFIIPICTLIQLMLCGIWLSTSPPFMDSDVHSEHGHIIIVCNKGLFSSHVHRYVDSDRHDKFD
ncbi:vomeronasal type-2 receptor 116-like, partial [Sigmodon hispidus]